MTEFGLIDARRFVLPEDLLDDCLGALRERGREGLELFIALTAVLEPEDRSVHFRRALIPPQTCLVTEGLLVRIEGQAIFELSRDCHQHQELLAGQIHAHPGRAYHSGADDALALIRLPGGLSIVVPDFASADSRYSAWSINQLSAKGRWRRLPRRVKLELG